MADKLTPKQEKFAQNVAKGMSKKDAAKNAGYSEKNAGKAGTVLTSKENPMVQKRISELQEKAADKAELSLGTHLKDLKDIRDGAMRNNAFSAAVTAEVARGKAAGLYVNRSELTVNRVDTMSKEEVLERMKQLYYDTGGILPAGKVIEVEPEELEEEEQKIITKNASDDSTS
jgi:phage terminase small subunit